MTRYRMASVLLSLILCIPVAIEAKILDVPAQECPVRFSEFPPSISSLTLGSATLTAPGLDTIQVLAPELAGFSVLRVDSKETAAIYGSYKLQDRPRTVQLDLYVGMRQLDWSTASDTPGHFRSTVRPGLVRVVLRYISPAVNKKSHNLVCFAMSPTFELTKSFELLSTE
jgi:hypothetical protein